MEKSNTPYTDGIATVISLMKKHEVDIHTALSYGRHSYSFDDLIRLILSGRILFYPLPNSVMLCEVHEAPQRKSFNCFVCAGDLAELLTDGNDLVMSEAKRLGCSIVTLSGRPGWKPTLEKLGWDHATVTLYKELD